MGGNRHACKPAQRREIRIVNGRKLTRMIKETLKFDRIQRARRVEEELMEHLKDRNPRETRRTIKG